MKIIDFESVKKLCSNINPSIYYDWIDEGLKDKHSYIMPTKTRIPQEDGNYYAVMPCLCNKTNMAMVKMIGRHTISDGEHRSTMMSDMLVYEANTGVLKALVDGEYITTLRTGAAAAHAAIMYGKKDFSTIALIGLGNIMTVCMSVLLNKLGNRHLTVRLYKHHNQEVKFAEKFTAYKNVNFVFCDTYNDTICGSDIIISAVTKVTENFCDDICYSEGCTVIPIMTLGFQNCDLFFDKVFTDEIEQIKGFKYFNKFKYIANTTDVFDNIKVGRENDKERILVYYYGIAVHDLYFASKIIELANDKFEFNYKYCNQKFFI
jgi:ornithine cyclodeaminase/alanine dehydrogenase-like protein (mu-crystallin family)